MGNHRKPESPLLSPHTAAISIKPKALGWVQVEEQGPNTVLLHLMAGLVLSLNSLYRERGKKRA